ncbi:MAG TPA: phosphatase PAP2 family protein [Longimicrobium sp.]|nr:phosphatase PAP2 family protein [Longimicrobium sp.]
MTHGRIHPADAATLGILAVVTATLAVAVARGAAPGGALALHAALLAGFGVLATWLQRRREWRYTAVVRGVAVIATMFTLYSTLGHVAFDAIPWSADPWLDAADRALLLGRSPSLAAARAAPDAWVEPLSFFYASFIPFLYVSILLGLIGRPDRERDDFVTGFAVLYALSFLGYLFLPARGPIVELAGQFPGELAGGRFHAVIVRTIDQLGGPHGAFPSLHVGASFYVTWFDLRHRNTLRGLIYLPLVALIAVATIALRYHWVVDLVAGIDLALVASLVAARTAQREAA